MTGPEFGHQKKRPMTTRHCHGCHLPPKAEFRLLTSDVNNIATGDIYSPALRASSPRRLSACGLEPPGLFLGTAGQVSTFHTGARSSFAPSTCRMPLGQHQCIPQLIPEDGISPRF